MSRERPARRCDTPLQVRCDEHGRAARKPRIRGADMFVLEAMNGPLDGKRWPFESAISIGRDAASVQAVVPTDRTVSRTHAEVSASSPGFALRDLGSSNGTLVDGRPIAQSVIIKPGQPFVVGRTMLRILELPDAS
jgi:pSer/pThr/pTyr-binding forkhead associated (FHA) protein